MILKQIINTIYILVRSNGPYIWPGNTEGSLCITHSHSPDIHTDYNNTYIPKNIFIHRYMNTHTRKDIIYKH